MKRFSRHLLAEAKKLHKKILLVETWDVRIIQAALQLSQERICDVHLLGEKNDILTFAKSNNISLPDTITYHSISQHLDENARLLYDLRAHKGVGVAQARELAQKPMYSSVLLLKRGFVDGVVSGATHTTADTLRPALQIIKTKSDVKLASSYFLMVLNNKLLFYADCGLNISPNAEELAHIAISSADSARALGIEPKVAMLSFSTKGSAQDPNVTKVQEAVKIARSLRPDIVCDGEMQVDAALVPSVSASKDPQGVIHGEANVLIFPDLGAGNISYKLTERLAKATAIGPIVQGLAKPVNDLSRGCNAEDITLVCAITSLQAHHGELTVTVKHEDILQ